MKHWTEDDFVRWIYAGEGDTAHLEECEQCGARAARAERARRAVIAPPDVSWEFLAAQRRSIHRRLGAEKDGSRSSLAWRWVAAVASLICIVALSLVMLRPWMGRDSALSTSSDEKLFADLASIEQSSEPRTIRPIHNLFQE